MIRNDVKDFVQLKGPLPHGSTPIDAFGTYSSNPSRFKFLSGDRKLIGIILKYVNDIETQLEANVEENHSLDTSTKNSMFVNKNVEQSLGLLSKLQSFAKSNLNRPKEGFRYTHETKMISSYLRMICGPLAYNTIQKNLQGVLPSIVSTNRYIKSSDYIVEGEIRGVLLRKYLSDRGLPLAVVLSDDATRVEGRIQYDSSSNQIVGFVLPTDKQTGMPLTNAYPAESAEQIFETFSKGNSVSSYVIAIMAQPLGDVPPFCLAMFGSDCAYTSEDVEHRWEYITSELNKLNIEVIIISSDSEPKYNRTMRKLSKLGFKTTIPGLNWFSCDTKDIKPPFYVQDPTHIGTKLRNFLLRFRHKQIPFSPTSSIELEHLYTLLHTVSKDQHLLTASTLNPRDRQNFSSVLRMCSKKVTTLLKEKVQDSEATVIFLEMIRDVLDSFMSTNLTPLERVEKIWYSVFILRIWKRFIKSHRQYKLKNSFLTSYCYSCIELNAHTIVLCLAYLKENNLSSWFQPNFYSSQPCESTFRLLRSLTTTYSTVANCSVKESVSRVSKIQLQSEIIHRNAAHFDFPKAKKYEHKNVHDLPANSELINVIEKCKRDAIIAAKRLGFEIDESVELSCDILPVNCDLSKKKKQRNRKIMLKRL